MVIQEDPAGNAKEVYILQVCKSFQGLLQIQDSNKVTAMLKKAKNKVFRKIDPRSPKVFWKTCTMLS